MFLWQLMETQQVTFTCVFPVRWKEEITFVIYKNLQFYKLFLGQKQLNGAPLDLILKVLLDKKM